MSTPEPATRVALVTGASRGIGTAIARRLADDGFALVVTGRDEAALEAVAGDLRAGGATVLAVPGDLSEAAFRQSLFKAVFGEFKRLDVLVNAAGALADGVLGMIRAEQIAAALALNLEAVIDASQQAARLMQRSGGGSIINFGSIMGERGAPGQAVYGAAKAGVTGFTRSAAKELGPKGVRVNVIAPGMIETGMLDAMTDAQRAERTAAVPLGRIGAPEEVAELAAFLASDRSAYITGQVIGIDGGMVI